MPAWTGSTRSSASARCSSWRSRLCRASTPRSERRRLRRVCNERGRRMRVGWCFVILAAALATATAANAQDFRVTLLGTGTPFPVPDRFGAATLVEAGPEKLLFDVGRGATIRLNQISVPIGALNAVFLTHFHSDHTSGIPDLWLTGWIQRYYGNRKNPFRVIGPKGTVSLMQSLERAYADDIRIR